MTCTLLLARSNAEQKNNKLYLVSPVFDLFFVCGGNVLLLLALTLAVPAISGVVPILLFLGTYLMAQPHLGASLARLYESKESIMTRPFLSLTLPIVLIGTTALALPNLTAHINVLSLVYLLFIGHHVLAQSYGIFLVYCARGEVKLSSNEKILLKSILYSSITAALIAQFTSLFNRQLSISDTAQSSLILPFLPIDYFCFAVILLAILALVFSGFQLNKFFRREKVVPFAAVLTMSVAVILLILAFSVSPSLWALAPAFYHGSQYLAITMAHRMRKKEMSVSVMSFLVSEYNSYLSISLALALGVPVLLFVSGMVPNIAQGMQLLFLLVSLHHFAVDSRIWKSSSGFKHALRENAEESGAGKLNLGLISAPTTG